MGTLIPMQSAMTIVVFGVVIVGVLVAIGSLVNRDDLYDQIGAGGIGDDRDRPREPKPSSPAGAAVQEEEVRQMVQARSDRRVRRGETPLDVDEEVAQLLRPQVDAGLRDEIRQLVVARNARRVRQGKEPLDVEAEIERQIAEIQ